MGFWLKAWDTNRKNTQPENMSDIVFEKVKDHVWTVKRTSVYAEAAVRRLLKKRCSEKFCRIHKKTCAGISFLVFSCQFCEIRKNTFFVEQHRTNASDYRSINSSEGSIDKQDCKLWYKNSSICVNLSQKCKLLRSAVQVKEQVSEAVICRPQIRCS